MPVGLQVKEIHELIHQPPAQTFPAIFRQKDKIPELEAVAATNAGERSHDLFILFRYPDMVLSGIVLMAQFAETFQDIAFETDAIAGFPFVDAAMEIGDIGEIAGLEGGADGDQSFPFFNSLTAKLAARAVSAM